MESAILQNIFGDLIIRVHPIGSTAINGIYAKPIIDLLPEVKNINKIDDYNENMRENDYLLLGEYGIPNRRFFIKGDELVHTCHVHMFKTGNPEIERHLLFRDYLKAHPLKAEEYSELKIKSAQENQFDIVGYMNGKNKFIKDIDKKAKCWRQVQK